MPTEQQIIQQQYAAIILHNQQVYDLEKHYKTQIYSLTERTYELDEYVIELQTNLEFKQEELRDEQQRRKKLEDYVKSLDGQNIELLKKMDQAEAQKLALKSDLQGLKQYHEREIDRLVDQRTKGLLAERTDLQKRIYMLEDIVNRQDVENQLLTQDKDQLIENLQETVRDREQRLNEVQEQLNYFSAVYSDYQTYQQGSSLFAQQLKQYQEAQRLAYQYQQEAYRYQYEQLAAFRQRQEELKKSYYFVREQAMASVITSGAVPSAAYPVQYYSLAGNTAAESVFKSGEAVQVLYQLQVRADDLQKDVQDNEKSFKRLERQIELAVKLARECLAEQGASAFVPSAQLEELNRQQNQLRGELYQLRVSQLRDKKRADAAEAMVSELEQYISALEYELLFFHTGNGGDANRRGARHYALYDALSGTKNVTLISGIKK